MFETEVEEWADEMYPCDGQAQQYLIMGAEFGYNKANEEHEEKCKTAYIKGIRTMANALKDYEQLVEENNKLLDVINNQDVKIADLEKKIEKMKCCGNCRYNSDMEEGIVYQECIDCDGKCNWKLEE